MVVVSLVVMVVVVVVYTEDAITPKSSLGTTQLPDARQENNFAQSLKRFWLDIMLKLMLRGLW